MINDVGHDQDRGFAPWIPFFRQWKIGCLVSLASFIIACALIVYIQPIYRAYIQLVLPMKLIEDPANNKSSAPTQADAYVVRSYSDIIKDDGVARKVIDDLHLVANPEFNPAPTRISQALRSISNLFGSETGSLFSSTELTSDRVLQDYEGRLKATSEGKALTVVLSFEAHDPHLAQEIVAAHAREFMQGEIEFRRRDAAAKVAWMNSELERATSEARDAQVALQLNPTANTFTKDVSAAAVSAFKMRQLRAAATQAVYDSVLKHYQDMVADQSYQGSEIRILSAATVPTHPYFPKKILFASVGGIISAILGCLAAITAALVRTKADINALAASCGLPVLGRINVPASAWIDCRRRNRLKINCFWQQIHELRSTMNVTDKRHPVVVVTSALPKEGKSLVASALARALASSGVRTVLIDLNSRNPRYGLSLDPRHRSTVGLQDFLEGSASAVQAAAKIDASTPLFLMSDNTTNPTDVSAISWTKLRSRLVTLKKEFNAIIIDTPAVESVSDAFQVASHADEIILTTLTNHALPEKVKEIVAKFRSRSAQVKGIVIVDENSPSSADLSRIASYPLRHHLYEIWPKAAQPSMGLARLLNRLLGRGATSGTQVEASA